MSRHRIFHANGQKSRRVCTSAARRSPLEHQWPHLRCVLGAFQVGSGPIWDHRAPPEYTLGDLFDHGRGKSRPAILRAGRWKRPKGHHRRETRRERQIIPAPPRACPPGIQCVQDRRASPCPPTRAPAASGDQAPACGPKTSPAQPPRGRQAGKRPSQARA